MLTRDFTHNVTRLQASEEIVCRTTLSLQSDEYLNDHRYHNSYILPSVFGLEAMTQVAARLQKSLKVESALFQKIHLAHAIMVSKETGVEIEIRANLVKSSDKELIRASISTAHSKFRNEHFSAELLLNPESDQVAIESISPFAGALKVDPKRHLYGHLLFHGPSFQRLEKIYELDNKRCVFSVQHNAAEAQRWLLGDLYARDALLQSAQLLVTPDRCLPIRIEKWWMRCPASANNGALRGLSIYETKENNAYRARVQATDPTGTVTDTIQGYWAQVLATERDWPTPQDLARL